MPIETGLLLILSGITLWRWSRDRRRGLAARRRKDLHRDLERRLAECTAQLGALSKKLNDEIVARERAEQALHRSEQELAEFFGNATVALQWLGPDGCILRANQAALDLVGYRREDYLGRHVADLHLDQTVIEDMLRRLDGGEALQNFETRVRCRDGAIKHISMDFSVLRESGQFIHTRCVIRDITQRKQTEAKLDRQLQSLKLLVAGAQKLAQSRDLKELPKEILQTVVNLFGMRLAWIGRAEPDGQVQPLYWAGEVGDYLKKVRIHWDDSPLGQGPAGVAVRTGRPVVMNVASDPNFAPWREPALAHGFHDVAAFPLISGDKPFGFLILYSGENGFFTLDRVELFESYAHIAAAVLENARLFEETKRSLDGIKALHEINIATTSTLDLDTVLNLLLAKIDLFLPYSGMTLRLLNRDTGDLMAVASRNLHEEGLEDNQKPGRVSRKVIETKTIAVSANIFTDPSIRSGKFCRKHGFIAYLVAPLIATGEVVGSLALFMREEHAFSSEEIEFITTLAGQAGMAIKNAQLYEQVRDGEERLRRLSHRLVETQEVERRYISRELHDEIGQALTALKLNLDISARRTDKRARADLSEAQIQVNELIARVRDLSLHLRPTMLDDLGLLPTLVWHCNRYSARTKVRVDLEHSGLDKRFPQDVATAAYRIVQEALTNVARHSGAAEVSVRLWSNEEMLSILVADKGHGFRPDALCSPGSTSGLSGMRERASSLGGQLIVESSPGGGTRVTATLPADPGFHDHGESFKNLNGEASVTDI